MNECLSCGKETKNPKFCNNSCAAKVNNVAFPKRKRVRKYNPTGIKCAICDNFLHTGKIYCSNSCRVKHIEIKLLNKIEENTGAIDIGNPSLIKKILISSRGDKCEICGIETWQNKKLIKVLDHIDGNSQNWSLDNLRLVCSNCDSQLPTYKNKNHGNGRYNRKERYKKNLSY